MFIWGKPRRISGDKAIFILENLFAYFLKRPEAMPPLYLRIIETEGERRAVADYIAGMTDDFAIMLFEKLFIPKIIF